MRKGIEHMLPAITAYYRPLIVFWLNLILALMTVSTGLAGPYPPGPDKPGSTAIFMDDPSFVSWATNIEVVRGPMDISHPENGDASAGSPELALGKAVGNAFDVVSLGDGGIATLTFDTPIINGDGFDFAVFENGFSDTFLELAFVEVSSDGINFIRFDSVSLTPLDVQVAGFGTLDPTDLDGLAGKYRQGYGTPFDLAELVGTPGLDVEHVMYVRIIDVVGSIEDLYATYDSRGNKVNDPWPTPFDSGGFDLEAVGVINSVTCEGDFDFDADVDGTDLDQLVWGVKPLDLALFADNFGRENCNK
jgi:hypothetical protein